MLVYMYNMIYKVCFELIYNYGVEKHGLDRGFMKRLWCVYVVMLLERLGMML